MSPDVESNNENIIGGNGGLQTDDPQGERHEEIANQRSTHNSAFETSQHVDRENSSRSTNDEPQSNSEECTSIEMDDYNDDSTVLKRVQTDSGNVSCDDDLPTNIAQESRSQDDRELNFDDISTTPKQTDLSHSDSYSAITNLWQSDLQTTSQHDSGRASQTGGSGGHSAHCNVSSGRHCLIYHGQVREETVRTPDIPIRVGGCTGPQNTSSPYCPTCGAPRLVSSGHHDGSHSRVCT